jgi:hypothetical protein
VSSTRPGRQSVAFVASIAIASFPLAALRAQDPATVQAVTPTSQQALTSTAVQQPPGVVVRDGGGNPLRGITVTFVPSTGGGTVSPASVVSGSNGIAQLTSWTSGSTVGTYTVFAKVNRLPAVVFTATTTQPAPATVTTTQPLRTAVPIGTAPRVSGLTISRFTLANGAATTGDRDVTYQLAFDGTTALYRIGEGARPTGAWFIASSSTVSGPLKLLAGPEGTRTLYLEMRRDASASATSIRTTSIQLKYPLQDVTGDGFDVLDTARVAGFSTSARKTSTSTGSILKPGTCTTYRAFMTAGDLALGPFSVGMSPETVCEFKLLSGRTLKPGWTLKSASVDLYVSKLSGAKCEIKTTGWGTANPELTIVLRHPGSLNPLDKTGTQCTLDGVVFRGPDDPDVTEGLTAILSTSW